MAAYKVFRAGLPEEVLDAIVRRGLATVGRGHVTLADKASELRNHPRYK